MPKQQQPRRTILHDYKHDIRGLEERVRKLENARTPTVPRYEDDAVDISPPGFPLTADSVRGQVAHTNNVNLAWFDGEEWRTSGARRFELTGDFTGVTSPGTFDFSTATSPQAAFENDYFLWDPATMDNVTLKRGGLVFYRGNVRWGLPKDYETVVTLGEAPASYAPASAAGGALADTYDALRNRPQGWSYIASGGGVSMSYLHNKGSGVTASDVSILLYVLESGVPDSY